MLLRGVRLAQKASTVNLRELPIARRSFLKAAAPGIVFAVESLGSIVTPQTPIERGQFSESDLGWVRDQLLELVNSERSASGLTPLRLDDLASQVANLHAADMAKAEFLSHWGSDGHKPYQRYSFAGGIDAMQENVSAADNIASVTPMRVFADLRDMHAEMHAETPPNDGHRQAILAPQHTHVGFGVALKGVSLRLTEIYLSRYLEIKSVPHQAKPKTTVVLNGRFLNAEHFLHQVDVFYEPLPVAPEIAWLRLPRGYSLPDEYVTLKPKAPEGTTYADGSRGVYEWNRNGTFNVPAKLFKDLPGIYSIVFWIRRVPAEKAFPAAAVCIRCEV